MREIYDTLLPKGWSEQPLRDVTIRRRGYSWEKEHEVQRPELGAVPVIRIPNISHKLDLEDLLWLRNVSEADVRDFAVEKNWILFVASNGNPDRKHGA